MELDDLKTAWQKVDRRPESEPGFDARLLRELKRGRTRFGLRQMLWLPLFELGSGLLAALCVGTFLGNHFIELRFALPAVVLHVAAVLTIVASTWQVVRIRRIDYAAPAIAIQRELALLRALRIRPTQGILVLSPLLWVPLAIVAAKGLFGLDVYRAFGTPWLATNVAFGLAVIPLAIWVTRRFGDRFERSRIGRRLADDIAGRSLVSTMAELDELARFEKEE